MRTGQIFITVDLNIKDHLNINPEETGIYRISFLTQQQDDKKKCDDELR